MKCNREREDVIRGYALRAVKYMSIVTSILLVSLSLYIAPFETFLALAITFFVLFITHLMMWIFGGVSFCDSKHPNYYDDGEEE